MQDNPNSERSEPLDMEWSEAPTAPRIYANIVNLDWTLYDVTLRFAQLKFAGDPRARKLTAEEQGSVTIAWAEAKYLRDTLTDLLSKYEKVNGEIRRPQLAPAE